MKTRVIICGGRDFDDKKLCFESLNKILPEYGAVEIVSGHAKGADSFGEEYGRENGIETALFPADWKRYGRAAGPVRNRQMLEYAGDAGTGSFAVIAFWDGKSRGTKDMIEKAGKAGAKVHIVTYGN